MVVRRRTDEKKYGQVSSDMFCRERLVVNAKARLRGIGFKMEEVEMLLG